VEPQNDKVRKWGLRMTARASVCGRTKTTDVSLDPARTDALRRDVAAQMLSFKLDPIRGLVGV